jgi:hypothetical protein
MSRVLCESPVESGRGQPHSITSRTKQHARKRASVLECGCPLPLFVILALAIASRIAEAGPVAVIRTPDGGIQPQAAVDNRGVVHLIYFKGEADGGNVFYVHRRLGDPEFSKPIKVNSQSGSVTAMGAIRGAQLAIGKNGRVHVVWDGMGKGTTRVKINDKEESPLLYTRLNDPASAFEPERNLITFAAGLDGGSSVAADAQGNVYVVWHAPQPGNTNGEAGRAVFIARSSDDGKTFEREKMALSKPTGACPCCGLRAFADRLGAVYILFRAATEHVDRDETLLISPEPGAGFRIASTHKWRANICPMSSATLTEAASVGIFAAWETGEQVYYAKVNSKTIQVSEAISPEGKARRKHPVAVANERGETLLVWTENTSWGKGGTVVWRQFNAEGKPISEENRADGLPAWSLATAFAGTNGDFAIVF